MNCTSVRRFFYLNDPSTEDLIEDKWQVESDHVHGPDVAEVGDRHDVHLGRGKELPPGNRPRFLALRQLGAAVALQEMLLQH